jgi:putative ABC transport system permease protein
VYIPYHLQKQLSKSTQTDRIMIQIRPDAEPRALIRTMDKVLERRLDRQQFQILTQEDLLGLIYKLMGILTWLLTGLTSIALFVGGVGIMAVMLMSVNERAYEIGIRKTVGARNRDIFVQFLLEAILLALMGSMSGLALSAVVASLLAALTPIKPILSLPIVGLGVGVCLGVGIVFGLIPAMNAARKDPVVCLRSAG